MPAGITEAELARVFCTERGVDMKRWTLEAKSRTTHENAKRLAALVGKNPLLYVKVSGSRLQRRSLHRKLSRWGRNILDGVLNGWQLDGLADCGA